MSFHYEIQDFIVIFTIDYAPSNSITNQTLQGLEEALDRVRNEEELKGLVITGNGRIFSSGFDLAAFVSFEGPEDVIKWFSYEEEVMYKLLTCPKPVVAAINGHATAAGMIIIQACDYRLIKDDPKIKVGMTEIKLGLALTPCQGEIMRFGLDTHKNWREIMYKGLLISPQKAVEIGILDELVEETELIEKAKAKVVEYIDTPNRSFIHLKAIERKYVARQAREGIDTNTYQRSVNTFSDPNVIASLKRTLERMGPRK
jgi:enoyl-CoA hydratase/carnithine racemase